MSYKNLTSENSKPYQNLNVNNIESTDVTFPKNPIYMADYNAGSFALPTTYGTVIISNFPDIPGVGFQEYFFTNPIIEDDSVIFLNFDAEADGNKILVLCNLGHTEGFNSSMTISFTSSVGVLIPMNGTAKVNYWILN